MPDSDPTDEAAGGLGAAEQLVEQLGTGEIEGQRRDATGRHEVTSLQTHSAEIEIGQRRLIILLIFNAQYRVHIASTVIDILARDAQADNRCLVEILFPLGLFFVC